MKITASTQPNVCHVATLTFPPILLCQTLHFLSTIGGYFPSGLDFFFVKLRVKYNAHCTVHPQVYVTNQCFILK